MTTRQSPNQATQTGPLYRYRVVEVWGVVPPQIAELLDDPTGFLLYPEDHGAEWQQDFVNLSEGRRGGWYMEYAGMWAPPSDLSASGTPDDPSRSTVGPDSGGAA